MKLTVQDLAMFIGCQCELIKADIPEQHKDHFSKVGDIVKVEPVLLLLMSQRDIEVKPVLRPLSDITEEELIEIAKIINGQPDSVKWKVEFNKYKNCHLIYRKHYQKRFTFCCETGEIECYDMDGVDESKDIYMNQHFVTKYLISKHFDVFGWIEKGLAIDKTKI